MDDIGPAAKRERYGICACREVCPSLYPTVIDSLEDLRAGYLSLYA